MAFEPIQVIIIAVVLVALFLWGPQKIPELARALGRARREFDEASREMNDAMAGKTPQTSPAPQTMAPEKTGDQILLETARQLGISTEGKTREQISQEIITRVNSRR